MFVCSFTKKRLNATPFFTSAVVESDMFIASMTTSISKRFVSADSALDAAVAALGAAADDEEEEEDEDEVEEDEGAVEAIAPMCVCVCVCVCYDG